MHRRTRFAVALLVVPLLWSMCGPLPAAARQPPLPLAASHLAPCAARDAREASKVFGFIDTRAGSVETVAVSGTLAYVVQGLTFVTLDLSTPAPVRRGLVPLDQWAGTMVLSGTVAYLQSTNGVQIVDVADPECPLLRGRYQTSSFVDDLVVYGTWLYLNTGNGTEIIDASDPDRPQQRGLYSPPLQGAYFRDWQIVGDRLYGLSPVGNFQIIDLAVPARPVLLGQLSLQPDVNATEARFAVAGTNAIIVGIAQNYEARLLTIDLRDAARPTIAQRAPFATADEVLAMVVQDGMGYLLRAYGGLQVADLRDLAHPKVTTDTGIMGSMLQVVGTHAYVAGHRYGLQTVDLQAVPRPALVSRYPAGGSTALYSLALRDDLLYANGFFADGTGSEVPTLQIFDVTNLLSPTLLRRYPFALQQLVGTRAYSFDADDRNTLQLFDLTEPLSPTLVGTLALPQATNVAVDAETALVAGSEGVDCGRVGCRSYVVTLQVVDVRTMASPVVVSTTRTEIPTASYGPSGLTLRGSLAYVVSNGQLYPIDLTTPAQPRVLPAYATPGSAVGLTLVGDRGYVVEQGGLSILDLRPPTAPVLLGSIALQTIRGGVAGVSVLGDLAFLRTYDSGEIVLDMADPTNPRPRARYPVTADVQQRGDVLYTAAGSLQVLQLRRSAFPPDLALPLIGR